MFSVSSSFQAKLEDRSSEPARQFLIGTSDYSDRVMKWPKIKKSANVLQIAAPSIQLDNADGGLNHFYENTYKMVQNVYLKLGFNGEYITLFTGDLKDVRYTEKALQIKTRDKLYKLNQRKAGDTESPVVFSETIPSDIAWDLCTCYGGLCNSKDAANADIDYTIFNAWAEQFSQDSVIMNARYEGMMISDALIRLSKMSDSSVFVDGDGKINFVKFIEPGSNDLTLTNDDYTKIIIDIEQLKMVNKCHVFWDYNVTSDTWGKICFKQESISVNSFGLHEEVIQDESIWYVNSVGAMSLADRRALRFMNPPKAFRIDSDLYGIRQELGDTIRFVDSFYGVNSGEGWRMSGLDLDMEKGSLKLEMDEALTLNAFYLDVSYLDGDEYLL